MVDRRVVWGLVIILALLVVCYGAGKFTGWVTEELIFQRKLLVGLTARNMRRWPEG
jgi:hypothetical protein